MACASLSEIYVTPLNQACLPRVGRDSTECTSRKLPAKKASFAAIVSIIVYYKII